MFHPNLCEAVATALKQKTMHAHQALEDLLIPRLHRIRAVEDYVELLKSFYGYFSPLEEVIEQHLTPQQLPDIIHRRKAAFLLEDMASLGCPTEDLPVFPDTPFIENEAQAWGALYVLEGSTLGGRSITRILLKQCGKLSLPHLKFFNGYGEETGPMWVRFRDALNALEYNDAEIILAVEAANETFLNFRRWIEQTLA